MAMDFPAPAAANDKFTDAASGKAYTFDGVAWKIDAGAAATGDFVLKAGDVMSGRLDIDTGVAQGLDLRTTAGVRTMSLSASSSPHSGIIEFWMPDGVARRGFMGYGGGTDVATNYLNLNPEGGKIHINAGGLGMQEGAGIHWGSTSAQSDVNNFSEGICMYGFGGTSQFGFNVTSGTLNASVQNTGNKFDVNIGGTTRQRTNSSGFTTYGNLTSTGPLIAQGTLAVTGATTLTGNVNIGGQTTVPAGNSGGINWGEGFQNIRMHSNLTYTTSNRHDFWVGGGLRYYIGVSGGSNALLTRDTALKEFADKDNFVNTNQVLNYAVAEIKALKAEIAALKAQPKKR